MAGSTETFIKPTCLTDIVNLIRNMSIDQAKDLTGVIDRPNIQNANAHNRIAKRIINAAKPGGGTGCIEGTKD